MTASKALSKKDMGGNKIENLGAPSVTSDAARKADVDTAYSGAISRANHTGTQTASTISDFDTQVRTTKVTQMAPPTAGGADPLSLNGSEITNVKDPGAAQSAATKSYVDQQVSGLVSGQTLKGSVRAYVGTNVTIASPGNTLDGLTPQVGETFLLGGQTTGTENGPYVWNGASTPMTRAANWDTNAEAVLGSYWVVREGTRSDSFALLTNDTTVTLGTTVPAFTVISVAGASIGRFAANCPAVSAGATWTVAHNLNSTDVHVVVKRVASPFDEVDVYWDTPDANNVRVIPDVALASGEYRAVVKY